MLTTDSNKILTHNNIKPFRQYGFYPELTAGNSQAVGNCVFCGRKEKFFLNIENKAWDCKVCSRSGGIHDFLEAVWERSKEDFKGAKAQELATSRGLQVQTLKDAGVGYFSPCKGFILPILDYTGKRLHSLKIYRKGKLLSTSGASNILYQGYLLEKGYFNIFLVEGEWDALTLNEALKKQEKKSNLGDLTTEVAIAVPGAQTFKKEWLGMFSTSNVSVLYDNDKAGREGSGKVYNFLKPICKNLNFAHWPTTSKEGEDMRDVYLKVKSNSNRFFKRIKKRLQDLPQDADKLEIEVSDSKKPIFEYKGAYLSPEEVHSGFEKYLILKDREVLDVMFSTMIANRMGGDPVWLFIVNNSGGSKSELIMSLDGAENVTAISSLTSNTLISGMETKGGGDPSLIPKLNGRVLTIKDYTTIFGMDKNEQNQITSQLRDAYDGKASKPYGNGQFRVFESTFGIIAGVTPAIERYMEGSTALGERFIRWRMLELGPQEEKAIQRKAMDNNAIEDNMRDDLKELSGKILSFDYLKEGLPIISVGIQDLIIDGSLWSAYMRGTVNRNVIGQVTQKANREIATRLTKVLAKLASALCLFRGRKEVNQEDFNTLKRAMFSSIPEMRTDIVKTMFQEGKNDFWEPFELSKATGVPKGATEKTMEDLVMLEMLERNPKKFPVSFRLTKHNINLIESTEVISAGTSQSKHSKRKKSKSNRSTKQGKKSPKENSNLP